MKRKRQGFLFEKSRARDAPQFIHVLTYVHIIRKFRIQVIIRVLMYFRICSHLQYHRETRVNVRFVGKRYLYTCISSTV